MAERGKYLIEVDGKLVMGYRIVRNGGSGVYRLSVPRDLAELVGSERRFTIELTEEGILYRYRNGGDPVPAPKLPAWMTS